MNTNRLRRKENDSLYFGTKLADAGYFLLSQSIRSALFVVRTIIMPPLSSRCFQSKSEVTVLSLLV